VATSNPFQLPTSILDEPRKDRRSFDLISDVLPFGRLWYDIRDDAIDYAMQSSRSHDAVIRVYDTLA
jgi:hypothetical protein